MAEPGLLGKFLLAPFAKFFPALCTFFCTFFVAPAACTTKEGCREGSCSLKAGRRGLSQILEVARFGLGLVSLGHVSRKAQAKFLGLGPSSSEEYPKAAPCSICSKDVRAARRPHRKKSGNRREAKVCSAQYSRLPSTVLIDD